MTNERKAATRRLVGRLLLVVVGMFGFGFALVPLYDLFCDLAGLNGKTGRVEREAALSIEVDRERWVTVRFVANVNDALPWEFRPLDREVRVHPGEIGTARFYARNRADGPVVGQAVPSLTPGRAARYFNKTECFCFSQQTLQAGEGMEMPIRFVVDPKLPKDVSTVILAYTFFKAKGGGPPPQGDVAQANVRQDDGGAPAIN